MEFLLGCAEHKTSTTRVYTVKRLTSRRLTLDMGRKTGFSSRSPFFQDVMVLLATLQSVLHPHLSPATEFGLESQEVPGGHAVVHDSGGLQRQHDLTHAVMADAEVVQ